MGTNLPNDLQGVDPGKRLGNIKGLADAAALLRYITTQVGLTASTTQTQAGGLADCKLERGINLIETSGNAADAAAINFTPSPGDWIVIINDGGNTVTLFPYTDGYLNDAAQNAGIVVADNTLSLYFCTSRGKWFGGAITLES